MFRPSALQYCSALHIRNWQPVREWESQSSVGWVVIGSGYQRVDDALRAPTCLLSVHEGEDTAGFSPSSPTRASFPYMHTMTQQWIHLIPVLYSEKKKKYTRLFIITHVVLAGMKTMQAWWLSSMTFWKPKVMVILLKHYAYQSLPLQYSIMQCVKITLAWKHFFVGCNHPTKKCCHVNTWVGSSLRKFYIAFVTNNWNYEITKKIWL